MLPSAVEAMLMALLARLQLHFDKTTGTAVVQPAAVEDCCLRVVFLPADSAIEGKTYVELIQQSRQYLKELADFHIRHYLPGYSGKLTSDLEVPWLKKRTSTCGMREKYRCSSGTLCSGRREIRGATRKDGTTPLRMR